MNRIFTSLTCLEALNRLVGVMEIDQIIEFVSYFDLLYCVRVEVNMSASMLV